MRKLAQVKRDDADAHWVVIYECSDGVYLFPCATDHDGSAIGDLWFSALEDADQVCAVEYGIGEDDWIAIHDPFPGCRHDCVAPTRIPGQLSGSPEFGRLERLVNGEWSEVSPDGPPLTFEQAIQLADAADDASRRR